MCNSLGARRNSGPVPVQLVDVRLHIGRLFMPTVHVHLQPSGITLQASVDMLQVSVDTLHVFVELCSLVSASTRTTPKRRTKGNGSCFLVLIDFSAFPAPPGDAAVSAFQPIPRRLSPAERDSEPNERLTIRDADVMEADVERDRIRAVVDADAAAEEKEHPSLRTVRTA